MTDVTHILSQINSGDPQAAEQLLPVLYDELRRLAAQKMAREPPGQTLDATGLVHEAYLRLVGGDRAQEFEGRGHFFAAAAEAMRRILIENARRKKRLKRGGEVLRVELLDEVLRHEGDAGQLLAIDEALAQLEQHDAQAAQLVKLRYFAGLEHQEAAQMLGITRRAADRLWLLARTWLFKALSEDD